MNTIELKTNIHNIVDRIQSEQLLRTLYDFLKIREKDTAGSLWESLTETQKQEVLLAYEESDDDSNLIEREKIFLKKK